MATATVTRGHTSTITVDLGIALSGWNIEADVRPALRSATSFWEASVGAGITVSGTAFTITVPAAESVSWVFEWAVIEFTATDGQGASRSIEALSLNVVDAASGSQTSLTGSLSGATMGDGMSVKTYVDAGDATTLQAAKDYHDANSGAGGAVDSVNGKIGDVTLTKADLGLGDVENTSDLAKPISTAVQAALDGKAAASHGHDSAQITDLVEAVQDIVGGFVVAGVGCTVTYDDTAGTFTINVTGGGGGGETDPEIVRDVIGGALVAGSGIQITVDDAGDQITIASTAVLPTRQITAGSGLTGGGDLGADRTLAADFGTGAGKITEGNDSRLSDARTPTAHANSHKAAGADALAVTDLGPGSVSDGQFVKRVGSALVGADAPSGGGGGGGALISVMTSGGNWTKPASAGATSTTRIIAIGGGGGGGSGRRGAAGTARVGGGGGGAGGYSETTVLTNSLPASLSVLVGTGGQGALPIKFDNSNGGNGGRGGDSRVTAGSTVLVLGEGGTGGSRGESGSGGAGGAGGRGQIPGSVGGSADLTGLVGGNAADGSMATGGGAGGGITTGNSRAQGGNGGRTGLTSVTGGSGGLREGVGNPGTDGSAFGPGPGTGGGGSGAGGTAHAGAGGAAGSYGGGGGGGGASLNGFDSGAGGNGGPGVVVLITTL